MCHPVQEAMFWAPKIRDCWWASSAMQSRWIVSATLHMISSPPPPVSTALVDPQNIDRLRPADRPEASPVLQWKGPVFKWQVQRHWSWSPNCFMTRTLPWRQKLKESGMSSRFPLYVAQPMPCQLMSLHVKEGVEKSNFLQTSYKYRP